MSLDVRQVGRRIRAARESKYLTVVNLASMVRMTESEIATLEEGAIDDIDFERLDALARALEVRMIELITEPHRTLGADEIAAEKERERESLWSGLPPSLRSLIDQECKLGRPVPEDIVRSLARIVFHDKQPTCVEEWRTILKAYSVA